MRKDLLFFKLSQNNSLLFIFLIFLGLYIFAHKRNDELHHAYEEEISARILDQNGAQLQILPNAKGQYMLPMIQAPAVDALVVRSEDRYFYFHLGIKKHTEDATQHT